jgi:hypothetical protein
MHAPFLIALFKQIFTTQSNIDGQPYFNLKAPNGQVTLKSEMYSSAATIENGIESVKKIEPDASINDLT